MDDDWGNAKERHNAVGAGRGSWNVQGEKRRAGNRSGNWKGHCSSGVTGPEASQHVAGPVTETEKGNLVKNCTVRIREKKL